MIFDTHAHYDDAAFDKDRDEIFARFPDCGIGTIVDPASTWESNWRVIKLTQKYDFLYGALGIHPSESAGITEEQWKEIEGNLHLSKIIAVGEIGLDYHYEEPSREWQKMVFRRQLSMAREWGLPVIIHSRDAALDTLTILKEERAQEIGGVIHCYSYSEELSHEFLKLGFYLGIGGVVTYKNARKVKETVKSAPMNRLVLETDCPYLSPVPHRGERNSSLNLRYVIEEIANLKGMTQEEVIEQTGYNALNLYPGIQNGRQG